MQEYTDKRNTWIGAIALALFPILAQYSLPIMSYGYIVLLAYFVIKFFDGQGCFFFNKSMLTFIVFALIQQLLVYMIGGTFSRNTNTYFFMVVCLFLLISANRINRESFCKVYYIVGVICSVVVLYQFVMGNILGIPQSAIQLLPVSAEDQHYWMTDKIRASGFFTEPQAFGSFILPLLVHQLFEKRMKSAVFLSICIFASTSSQGIIMAFIVWAIYLFIYQRSAAKKLFIGTGVVGAAIIALVVLRNVGVFSFAIDKILSINLFSYDIRLTKGFEIFFSMPFKDMLVGIGNGNLATYLVVGGFSFFWMSLTQEQLFGYITTMSNVLVSFGIVGFIFYINIFVKNFKTVSMRSRFILLLILMSSFTQTILFNAWFVLYWIIFELFDEVDTNRYWIVKFHTRR